MSTAGGRLVIVGFFPSCAGNLYADVTTCPQGLLGDVLVGDGNTWRCMTSQPALAKVDAEHVSFSRPPPPGGGGLGCTAACVAGGSAYVNGTLVPSADVLCTVSNGTAAGNASFGAAWTLQAPLPAPTVGATFVDPLAQRWLWDDPALIGPDWIHPDPAGQRYLAEKIAPLIQAELPAPRP